MREGKERSCASLLKKKKRRKKKKRIEVSRLDFVECSYSPGTSQQKGFTFCLQRVRDPFSIIAQNDSEMILELSAKVWMIYYIAVPCKRSFVARKKRKIFENILCQKIIEKLREILCEKNF